jgi:adenylate cyclase
MHLVRGEFGSSKELSQELLRMAQNARDHRQLGLAHNSLALPLFHRGELLLAREHNDAAIALYDRARDAPHRYTGIEPGTSRLSYACWIMWHLGYPDQALKRSKEARALAEALSHPDSLAFAMGYACNLHVQRREVQAVREAAERNVALCSQHNLATFLGAAKMYLGWVMAGQGKGDEGIALIAKGVESHRVSGFGMMRPNNLLMLASACLTVGRFDEGLAALAEALVVAEAHEEHAHTPETPSSQG